MYESPINLINKQVSMEVEKTIDGEIWKAIKEIGIDVDKEELIRALKYDRDQYIKGYNDAKRRGYWIEVESDDPPGALGIKYMDHKCSVCGYTTGLLSSRYNYCPSCGARLEKYGKTDNDTN